MRRIISLFLVVAISATCLTGCCLKHEYAPATCTAPQTCTKCGKTDGEPLGHTWSEATCTAPKTCSTCNSTEGEPLAHTWISATCTKAKTCKVCSATEGKSLGHAWISATCTKAKTCSRCKITSGQPIDHEPDDYTGLCTYCGTACYSLDNIVLVFTQEATEFCQLMLDLIDVIGNFVDGHGSKTEYSNVLSNLGDSYTNIVILANYAISHPDFNSSSKRMICLGNVYDEATVSYEVALSTEDYSTFYGYWYALLIAEGDLLDAISALSAYL